jgi:hypothetical protein
MTGGLDGDGMWGPPLFMAIEVSHGLCSGEAKTFDVPLLNLGAGSKPPLWLFLLA